MSPWFSFLISTLALAISGITAWLTFFRKGKLMMTQPTVAYLGPDGSHRDGKNKIYLRTLLYSTAKRGQVLESLHVAVQRSESKQNFSVWVYGHKDDLRRGSGLFVPQDGVTFDHHFLQPADGTNFAFLAGNYRLTVFAKLVGAAAPRELMTLSLMISDAHAGALAKPNTGIYFDWGPDLQNYHAHIEGQPIIGDHGTTQLMEALSLLAKKS
jgi:hypothetical protein